MRQDLMDMNKGASCKHPSLVPFIFKPIRMTIFESLRQDHDLHRELLDKLVETSGDTEDRKRLYLRLKHELEIHADAEERYFYKPLIDSDKTQDQARHGIAEHHEIDELLEKMDETDYSSPAWLGYAKELKAQMEHHYKDEEHEFFQMAGKVFHAQQKTNLGAAYHEYIEEHR